MKKSKLILLSALGAILFFSLAFQLHVNSYVRKGAANKVPVKRISETRETPNFNAINAQNSFKIRFRQSETPRVHIQAPDYLMDSISATVTNKELILDLSSKLKKKDSIIIQIASPQLISLKLGSDVYFETVGNVSGENLRLEFTDESSGNLELAYGFVNYINSTKGKVNLKGEIKKIDMTQTKK